MDGPNPQCVPDPLQVEDVYEVYLPAQVRDLMSKLSISISLGLNGVPLSCVGATGYVKRLVTWMLTPVALIFLVVVGLVLHSVIRRWRCPSFMSILEKATPVSLRLLFLVYPIVCTVAFEAFSCFEFEGNRGWLVADTTIQCRTSDHDFALALAWVAIALYPVGMLVLNASLLFCARKEIRSGKPSSRLSKAIAFLYKEYEPHVFWW